MDQFALILRALLALAYPVLAHLASTQGSGVFAALAIVDIVAIVLVSPLLAGRAWAWLLAAALLVGVWVLSHSVYARVPLLLVPVAFMSMVSWAFARTLRPGAVPLITRIVSALDATAPPDMAPELLAYTRGLTRCWALLLALLALCNLVLAAIAVPRGLLVTFGVTPPVSVTDAQWSWFANILNYGLMGGLFVVEYLYRKHRFPDRYRSLAEFLRRMAGLGPAFWRDFLR